MGMSTRKLGELAGLSHVTVYRALNGSDAVSEKTRRRVLALARKHNYPLPAARTPETPNLLRVLCSLIDIESDETHTERGFNRRLLAGLQQGATEVGVDLANFRMQANAWPLIVSRRQVDGAVLPMGDEFAPHPPLSLDVPTVFIFNGPKDADVVTVENFDACRMIGQHLAALGHRRVAYIGPETDMSRKRLFGLRAGLEPEGGCVPPECVRTRPLAGSRDEAVAFTDSLLPALHPGTQTLSGPTQVKSAGFTALVAYNDYMAAAAIMDLRKHGVRVPEDVSVVGFDNVRPGWYEGPALTTANMPLEELGAEAVRLLYWRIAHPGAPRRRLLLGASFVAGETVRPVDQGLISELPHKKREDQGTVWEYVGM
ncbi:MAG: LacI family transcriptional regulator [Lentisphaerae bacterium]|nr:LacI family transcriptional regulator [Lentisphaerota bacterium]